MNQLSSLRAKCLLRDHHRCVISGLFDETEATLRFKRDGDNATDDDGLPLKNEMVEYMEVAHIIPYALGHSNTTSPILVRFASFTST